MRITEILNMYCANKGINISFCVRKNKNAVIITAVNRDFDDQEGIRDLICLRQELFLEMFPYLR